MSKSTPWRSLALLAAAALLPSGCGPLGPVLRHPFVEDRTVALAEEDLILTVERDAVVVDALFAFEAHGPPLARTVTFPVGTPGGPAADFAAWLERPEAPATPLPCRRAAPGALPVGPAGETWDIELPAAVLAPGNRLRVRYRQAPGAELAYVLRTGALWRGPIRRLDVRVDDPTGRVVAATVEDRAADASPSPGVFLWTFRDLEPRGILRIHLRQPPSPDLPHGAARP